MWRLLAVLLLLAGAARAEAFGDDWKRPTLIEAAPMAITIGLIWVDVLQTRDGLQNGRYEENIILGKHPSDAKLLLVGGVLPTLVLTLVWFALPEYLRTLFIATPLLIEGETVWENASKGLTIRF